MVSNAGAAAGQVIFHTHVHLIPRFPGDGLDDAGPCAEGQGAPKQAAQALDKAEAEAALAVLRGLL